MQRQLIISGIVFSLLAGCSSINQSKVNPLNWFGASEQDSEQSRLAGPQAIVLPSLAPGKGYASFVDTRPLISDIVDLKISKTSSGAIITATGRAAGLGYFDAQLVPVEPSESGELILDFKIRAPSNSVGSGTARQREITVARSISNVRLSTLTSVTVRTANGSQTTRR